MTHNIFLVVILNLLKKDIEVIVFFNLERIEKLNESRGLTKSGQNCELAINFWTTLEWPLEGRPTLFSFTLCVSEYNVLAFVIIKIKIRENKKKRLPRFPYRSLKLTGISGSNSQLLP